MITLVANTHICYMYRIIVQTNSGRGRDISSTFEANVHVYCGYIELHNKTIFYMRPEDAIEARHCAITAPLRCVCLYFKLGLRYRQTRSRALESLSAD